MNKTALHWLGHSLVVAAAALLTGCANEAPVGPERRPASAARAELGDCDSLNVPAGSKLAFHAYAKGVQIYHWNGSDWSFDGPSAVLSSDAEGEDIVGTHYSGPRWKSLSGGTVKGEFPVLCAVDPDAIPWLLLRAVPDDGPGVFQRVAFIQRVNTVGGKKPPLADGHFTGQVKEVPYTAEYFFYRAP
jgi:hypothetical protein